MTHQKRGITRSTNKKETARRFREQMIFQEAMALIHREAKLAAIGSYLLEFLANEE